LQDVASVLGGEPLAGAQPLKESSHIDLVLSVADAPEPRLVVFEEAGEGSEIGDSVYFFDGIVPVLDCLCHPH